MTHLTSHLTPSDAIGRGAPPSPYTVRVDTGSEAVRRTLRSLSEHSLAGELPCSWAELHPPNLAVSAWDGNRLAGIALATSDFNRLTCITQLVVDAPHRRQGIARELMCRMQSAVCVARVLLLATPVIEPYDPARRNGAAAIRAQPSRLTTAGAEPRWLRTIEQIVASEYPMKLTVGHLARRVGIHPVHVSRTFRRLRQESIIHALARRRIDAACRQLMRGDVFLATLALDVGFNDQAQFCRAFKRITGTTPGSFRALFRPRRDVHGARKTTLRLF